MGIPYAKTPEHAAMRRYLVQHGHKTIGKTRRYHIEWLREYSWEFIDDVLADGKELGRRIADGHLRLDQGPR